MSKLPIPVSAAIGTSLTKDELKHVLGGQAEAAGKCLCIYKKKDGTSWFEVGEADDKATCADKCHNFCLANPTCTGNTYTFS